MVGHGPPMSIKAFLSLTDLLLADCKQWSNAGPVDLKKCRGYKARGGTLVALGSTWRPEAAYSPRAAQLF